MLTLLLSERSQLEFSSQALIVTLVLVMIQGVVLVSVSARANDQYWFMCVTHIPLDHILPCASLKSWVHYPSSTILKCFTKNVFSFFFVRFTVSMITDTSKLSVSVAEMIPLNELRSWGPAVAWKELTTTWFAGQSECCCSHRQAQGSGRGSGYTVQQNRPPHQILPAPSPRTVTTCGERAVNVAADASPSARHV